MKENGLQVGKTRYTHYTIAYHLVWIPKYRRRILTGEVQKETKRLIAECCEQQGMTLLAAVETDEDHIHVFVSAPPRFSPAITSEPPERLFVTVFTSEVSPSQKNLRKGA